MPGPPISGEELIEVYRTILTGVLNADLRRRSTATSWPAAPRMSGWCAKAASGAEAALYRLRATGSYREIVKATVRRQKQKDVLAEFFTQSADAILMPISPVTAFRHMHEGTFTDRKLDVDGIQVRIPPCCGGSRSRPRCMRRRWRCLPGARAQACLPACSSWVRGTARDRLFDIAAAVEESLGGFSPPATPI